MKTFKKLEEMEIWLMARSLNQLVFQWTRVEKLADNYQLRDHVLKTAGSIMDNIAEGQGRDGSKEFLQFLSISKGSCRELKSQLYRCLDQNLINQDSFRIAYERIDQIESKMFRLMQYLRKTPIRGGKYKD